MEEKYEKILFMIAEYALLGKNDKVKEIITQLNNWRYAQVNSVEGQTEKEYKDLIDYHLQKVIDIL